MLRGFILRFEVADMKKLLYIAVLFVAVSLCMIVTDCFLRSTIGIAVAVLLSFVLSFCILFAITRLIVGER